jgi:hypothetical protein
MFPVFFLLDVFLIEGKTTDRVLEKRGLKGL